MKSTRFLKLASAVFILMVIPVSGLLGALGVFAQQPVPVVNISTPYAKQIFPSGTTTFQLAGNVTVGKGAALVSLTYSIKKFPAETTTGGSLKFSQVAEFSPNYNFNNAICCLDSGQNDITVTATDDSKNVGYGYVTVYVGYIPTTTTAIQPSLPYIPPPIFPTTTTTPTTTTSQTTYYIVSTTPSVYQIPQWVRDFQNWSNTHCGGHSPLNPGTPSRHYSVAFIPVKYSDDIGTHLTIGDINDRVNYIGQYYFQQSGCYVILDSTIVNGPAAGWWTLPRTRASYHAITPTDADNLAEALTTWSDAVRAAGANPAAFDAVVVINTASNLRSRNFMPEQVARSPQAHVLLNIILPLVLCASVIACPLVATILPLIDAAGVLLGGSVITSDQVPTEVWAHELGHALFEFWDYYGTTETFVRGMIYPWGLMSNPSGPTLLNFIPPPPISTFNRQKAGWVHYFDQEDHSGPLGESCNALPDGGICWKDPPRGRSISETLTPVGDLTYGSTVYRFQVQHCGGFIGGTFCAFRGDVDWYTFELRSGSDQVPNAPEQTGVPASHAASGLVIYGKREWHGPGSNRESEPACGSISGLVVPPLIEAITGDDFKSCYDSWSGTPDGLRGTQNILSPGQCLTEETADVTFCFQGDGRTLRITADPDGTPITSRTVISMNASVSCPQCASLPSHIVRTKGNLTLPVNLHVYSSTGQHCGNNLQTGGYDLQIPGCSAQWIGTQFPYISIPDNIQAKYTIDASQALANLKGFTITPSSIKVNATILTYHYDANGNIAISRPITYKLSGANLTTTATIPVLAGTYAPTTTTGTATSAVPTTSTAATSAATGAPPGAPKCLIATATFGSELAPEVQLLRDFRDDSIVKTAAGSNFMIAFNAWYYSFSPYVANYIANHWVERTIMKGVLYPLIGIMFVSSETFTAVQAQPEFAALLSGLVASALIGAFYVGLPVGILRARVRRLQAFDSMRRIEIILSTVLLGSLVALFIAEVIAAPPLLMISSAAMVLSTLFLSAALTSTRIARKL